LKKDNQELAVQRVSLNPPTVHLVAPNGGESLSGLCTVAWTASDPDGDALRYTVLASTDNMNWTPLAIDLTQPSFAWDTRLSPGSTNCRIMVVANDGVNQTRDVSDGPFTVMMKGPTITISSPTNGAALPADQSVLFVGSGFDFEDGDLPDSALTFTSDRDGLLGKGRSLPVAELSVGTHKITLTGVDKDNNAGATSITVSVASAAVGSFIDVTPTNLVFGSVIAGQTKDMTVQISHTNTGPASLTIQSMTSSNARFTEVAPSLPLTLAPGGKTSVTIRFAPVSASSETGTLTITSDDPNQPVVQVTLSGQGTGALVTHPISGNQNGTLGVTNSPYLVTSDLYVPPGQTLTIEPGVILQFQNPNTGLIVDGSLVAKGTASNPIVFTSDETVKQPGQWSAIAFRDSSVDTNCVMEYCIIEYGGGVNGADENVRLEYASPTIRNCTIQNGRVNGLRLWGSDPTLSNCRFLNNSNIAVSMRADSFPKLQNNTATGNGQNALGIWDNSLNRSGTWMKDNLPYTLLNWVGVNGGLTLTIEPGVVVQCQTPDTSLFVDGSLIARGTADQPIVFTSDKSIKQPGQWGAVVFHDSSVDTNCVMEYCIVECGAAKGVADESIRVENASPTLRNCTVQHSRWYGINLLNSDVLITNCQFLENGSFALAMRIDSFPKLQNNTAAGNGQNAIGVWDSWTSRSGSWVKDNLPYTLMNYIGVSGGKTLTIDPGVIVQFQYPDTSLLVDGVLFANGLASQPIRFTSDKSLKQPGQWQQIQFRNPSGDNTSILNYCLIEYGGLGAEGSLTFYGASPRVTNTTVRFSSSDGIYANNSSVRLSQSRILNNGRDGIRTDNMAKPTIANTAISGNTGSGVNNLDTRIIVPAENNFWGHASGPLDKLNLDNLGLTNVNGLGDKVSEYVDWSPFLGADPTAPFLQPEISISPARIFFGNVASGQSADVSLTVTNFGTVAVTVTAARSNNPQFRALTPLPFTVGPGASQILTVRFSPTLAGSQMATLSVENSDPARSLWTIPLQGNSGALSGLRGEFFQFNRSLDHVPNLIGIPADYTGTFTMIEFTNTTLAFSNIDGIIPRTAQSNVFLDNFAARFTGTLHVVTNGDYTFSVTSDDGAILKLNGTVLLDQNYTGSFRTMGTTLRMAAGDYPVELDYFEQGGYAGLNFLAAGPGPVSFTTNATPTALEVNVASGFAASTFAEGIGFPIGLAFSSNGASGERLLVGDGASSGGFGSVLKYDSNAVPTQVTDSLTGPVGLAVDAGTQFGGNLLAIDDSISGRDLPNPGNRDIGTDRLKRIASDGKTTDFAGFPGAFSLAFGKGAFGSDLYVADYYAQKISRVNASGTATDFVVNRATFGIVMSESGSFSNALYACDYYNNALLRMGADGKVTTFATNIPSPVNLALDLTGKFGGDLFVVSFVPDQSAGTVSTKKNGAIYRVWPDGTASLFATGLAFGSLFSGDLAFGFGGDLFALEAGRERIVRFAPSSVPTPMLQLSSTSLDFGSVSIGQTKDLSLILTNAGNALLTIQSLTSDNDRFLAISPIAPFNLAAGATAVVVVRFQPAAATTEQGLLTFTSTDPNPQKPAVSLSGIGLLPSVNPVPVPAGLVAWWPANGNAKDVKGTNDGVLMNGADFAIGMVDHAFIFDGIDDYVSTPLDVSPGAMPTTTWEAWVLPTRAGGQQQILSDDDGSYDRSVMVEGLNWGVFTGNGVWTPITLNLDLWQHIAVIFSPTNIEFFKNGVRYSYGAAPVRQTTGNRLQIGRNPGFGEYFQGKIDEVSIYNRALSPQEIQSIYAAGSGGKQPIVPVVPVSLSVTRSDTNILISWPASATNYVLQSAVSLSPPIRWTTVNDAPTVANGLKTLVMSPSTGTNAAVFFRLAQGETTSAALEMAASVWDGFSQIPINGSD
jgi:parallel beta-helix repeat protein